MPYDLTRKSLRLRVWERDARLRDRAAHLHGADRKVSRGTVALRDSAASGRSAVLRPCGDAPVLRSHRRACAKNPPRRLCGRCRRYGDRHVCVRHARKRRLAAHQPYARAALYRGGLGHRERGRVVEIPMRNRLRVLRAERDWSQAELAEQLGVSRQTANALETGKYAPSLPLAFKVAKIFGLPIESIFMPESEEDVS